MEKPTAQHEKASGEWSSTVVAAGVTIRGDIEGPTDLHVQGKVLGDVSVQGLILDADGEIDGSVMAAAVVISGHVSGPVEAKAVHIKPSGRVEGDVTYATLQIDNGARLSGRLIISDDAELGVAKPADSAPRAVKHRSELEESGQELVRMAARLRRASE